MLTEAAAEKVHREDGVGEGQPQGWKSWAGVVTDAGKAEADGSPT